MDLVRKSTETGVSAIVFNDMDIYEDIICDILGLQHNSGTPNAMIQLSDDNGSTWDSTNYLCAGNTGTDGFRLVDALPVTTDLIARVEILHFNKLVQTFARIGGGRAGATTGRRNEPMYNSQAVRWNALRITNSGPTNWTANLGVNIWVP